AGAGAGVFNQGGSVTVMNTVVAANTIEATVNGSDPDVHGTLGGSPPLGLATTAASQLALTSPRGTVSPGSPFSITVRATDAAGKPAATFNGAVTLSLTNPQGATLGGTLTVTATGGVATFSGLTVSAAGTAYVMKATAAGPIQGLSPSFDVTADFLVVSA